MRYLEPDPSHREDIAVQLTFQDMKCQSFFIEFRRFPGSFVLSLTRVSCHPSYKGWSMCLSLSPSWVFSSTSGSCSLSSGFQTFGKENYLLAPWTWLIQVWPSNTVLSAPLGAQKKWCWANTTIQSGLFHVPRPSMSTKAPVFQKERCHIIELILENVFW